MLLLVILVVILIAVLPGWRQSGSWGCAPSGCVGLVLLIVMVLMMSSQL